MNGASFYFWLLNANLWAAFACAMDELHKSWVTFAAVSVFSFIMAALRVKE